MLKITGLKRNGFALIAVHFGTDSAGQLDELDLGALTTLIDSILIPEVVKNMTLVTFNRNRPFFISGHLHRVD